MSEVLEKIACPKCSKTGKGSSFAVYDDGHKYCFECGHLENEKATGESQPKKSGTNFSYGVFKDITDRGITKETCKKFNYSIVEKNGKTFQVANYCNLEGDLVAQKARSETKKFYWKGDTSSLYMFGQHLYTPNKNLFLTITEGEIDTLSVAEMQGSNYPVVSIHSGAGSAFQTFKENLKWLMGFKHIVLAFDMDEAGQSAARECATLFEPGYCKIAKFELKDANEMLLAGKGKEFINALFSAESFRPDGIVCLRDIKDKCLIPPKMGISWPWPTLTKLTYGIQQGGIYTIGAGSGIGKTSFMNDVLLHLVSKENKKIGIFSFEEEPALTGQKLAGGLLNTRLHVPGSSFNEQLVSSTLDTIADNVYLYDHYGVVDMDSVSYNIRYLVKGVGCDVVVVDPFTMLTAGFKDERKDIDAAMATFRKLAQELKCIFFLVSHLAKPMDGDSYEEGRRVVPAAFRGSNSIQMFSYFMIGLERNKLSENKEEKNITKVRILKDRLTGEADGATIELRYDTYSGKLVERDTFYNIDKLLGRPSEVNFPEEDII